MPRSCCECSIAVGPTAEFDVASSEVDHVAVRADFQRTARTLATHPLSNRRFPYSRLAISDHRKAAAFAESLASLPVPDWGLDVGAHRSLLVDQVIVLFADAFPVVPSELTSKWFGLDAWALSCARCGALRAIKNHNESMGMQVLVGHFGGAWIGRGLGGPVFAAIEADALLCKLSMGRALSELYLKRSARI